MKIFVNAFVGFSLLMLAHASHAQTHDEAAANAGKLSIKIENGALRVYSGSDLFTAYDYSNYGKPILYPVHGPGQVPMTRNYPMKNVEGEANDHPHHKSIWLGHYLNGHDFWAEGRAKIKHASIDRLDSEAGTFTVTSQWKTLKDELVCMESTTCKFGVEDNQRWIDFEIVFTASEGDVTFEDTKEGLFAIRTHPDLRLRADPNRGVEKVFGNAINSSGVKGKDIWGKNAKWVNYAGPVDSKYVGVLIMDHPSNFRHPTTWHAREYGLVAANPFGLHYFKNQEKGAGAHTIKKGEQMQFKYRVVFYAGERSVAQLNELFDQYATAK